MPNGTRSSWKDIAMGINAVEKLISELSHLGVRIPPIEPKGDKLLIFLEPEQDRFSSAPSLIKPEAVKQDHVFRVGRVIRAGPGEWNKKGTKRIPIGINVGMRVLFIKFVATHTQTAKGMRATLGEEFALIDKDDCLLELSEDICLDQISQ